MKREGGGEDGDSKTWVGKTTTRRGGQEDMSGEEEGLRKTGIRKKMGTERNE